MQVRKKEYNPSKHDKFTAITIRQPFASDMVITKYVDEDGMTYGFKSIEIRMTNVSYRGDVLICSAKQPVFPNMDCGATLGFAELYEVKPASELTEKEWEQARIPKERRKIFLKGYAYKFRNPRKVIEYPVKGEFGLFNVYYTKGEIVEYPKM